MFHEFIVADGTEVNTDIFSELLTCKSDSMWIKVRGYSLALKSH